MVSSLGSQSIPDRRRRHHSILCRDPARLADVRTHAEQSACPRTTGELTRNDWTAADMASSH
jgi:hypothetical protein